MRAFNTERRLSVPALPLEPPTQFKKDYYNLLMGSGNPFHRRGTEVSQGFDVYQLRKHSLSHMNDPSWTPKKSLAKSPSSVKLGRNSETGKVRFALSASKKQQ